jgi:O-antigen ligase
MYENLIWLVPAVILLAGLWWPRAGLVVFAATLPLFGAPPGGPYLGALDVAALAAIVTGLRAGRGQRSVLDTGVLVFVVVAVAAFFPLAYRPPSWSPGTIAQVLAFLPEVESWTILHTWRALANVFLGAGLYLAVKRAFGRGSVVALGSALGVGLLAALALGFVELAGWVDLWSYRPVGLPIFDKRYHSIFFHSGWVAEFVVVALPMAVAAWAGPTARRKALAFALVVLGLGAVLLSGQRGAWFTALAQITLAALLLGRSWLTGRLGPKIASLSAGLAALAILVAGIAYSRPEIGESLQTRLGKATANLSNRTMVWEAAADMASDRPLLGWGTGSFSPVLDLQVMAEESDTRISGRPKLGHHHSWITAHSTYFMLLAERGILGLASMALLGVMLVLLLWRARGSDDLRVRRLAVGLLVSTAGFAVYGLVQYMFFPRANGFLIWILLGCAATLDDGAPWPRLRRAAQTVVAIALLLLPLRALFWEPAPRRGDRSFGFHAAEKSGQDASFQWTAARRAVRRIEWEDEVLRLSLANGHPKASARPVLVEVMVDGAIVGQVVAGEGWQDFSAYLGTPKKETILLEVLVDRTFRPFSEYRRDPDLADSRDLRRLGIAVGEISWAKAPRTRRLRRPEPTD